MAKKIILHAPTSCGAEFEIKYTEENLPFLQCTGCGHILGDWEKWYKEYCKFWQDPIRWKSKKDHITCLLGYFVHLYENYYNMKFTFSLNEKGLFRGPETTHLRRMYKMFDENADVCKSYLDWIFAKKVIAKKKKITSLGFLAVADIVSEFKFCIAKSKQINRNTALPASMLDWLKANLPTLLEMISLKDFGDLHLLLSHFKNNRITFPDNSLDIFVSKLKSNNFINDDLQIKNWSE